MFWCWLVILVLFILVAYFSYESLWNTYLTEGDLIYAQTMSNYYSNQSQQIYSQLYSSSSS